MWFADQAQLQIGLLEDRVVVLPAGRRTQAAEVLPVVHAPAGGEPPWQPAVRCLTDWLGRQERAPAKAQVRLGSGFVRWQLLDWAQALQQEQELQAYAQLQMRAAFGPAVQTWRVVHGQASPGHALPVCAADEALTDALRALQAERGLQVTSVAPYFALAFDHWRNRLPRRGVWFGVVEPQGLTLGLLISGQWGGLRTQRLAPDEAWPAALPSLQAQLALAAGQPYAVQWPVFMAGCVKAPAAADGLSWLAPAERAGVAPIDRLAWGV